MTNDERVSNAVEHIEDIIDIIKQKSVRERICLIQNELNVPKSNYNKFGGYAYRSAEDIMKELKPLLQKYRMSLYIVTEPFELCNWRYIRATVRLETWDNYGDTVIVQASAREGESKKGMDVSQVTGSAMSYAIKYALGGLFLIDDTKDEDANEYHEQTSEKDYNEIDELNVTLHKLMNRLETVGVDLKDESFVEFVKENAKVPNLDAGYLAMNKPEAQRVMKLYAQIIEKKANEKDK